MDKTITLTLTFSEALNLRLALNAKSSDWSVAATKAREAGDTSQMETCLSLAADYSKLWGKVYEAQQAKELENV